MPTLQEQFIAGGTAPVVRRKRRPKGLIYGALDIIDRPRLAISEAVGAGLAGEDILEAGWEGLKGRELYPSIGYQVFKEAQEPGFQAGDVPAFAVNLLTDPFLWLGPGIFKAGGKVAAKGVYAAGKYVFPTTKGALPKLGEEALALSRKARIDLLKEEMETLGLDVGGLIKRFEEFAPSERAKELFGLVKRSRFPQAPMSATERLKYLAEKTEKIATGKLPPGFKKYRFAKAEEYVKKRMKPTTAKAKDVDAAFYKTLEGNGWLIDEMRSQMRLMDINYRPTARNALGSLAKEVGQKWLPIVKTAKLFGGKAGQRFHDAHLAIDRGRKAEFGRWGTIIDDAFEGLSKAEEEQVVRLLEMGSVMAPMTTAKARRAAAISKGVLRAFRDDLAVFRDPLGNPLYILDPRNGRKIPFEVGANIKNYYPRMYKKEVFEGAGRKELYDRLTAQGIPKKRAEDIINRLAHKPRTVGNIELARLGNEAGYSLESKNVLKKYIWDGLGRKYESQQFGVNNEILETILGDLRLGAGFSEKWISSARNAIVGRNLHDDFWDKFASGVNTFQAIAKLGYNTSVSNFGQGPMNQTARSGVWNAAQSFTRALAGSHPEMKMAAYSRFGRQDIIKGMTGSGRNRFLDTYMTGIGFTWTEKTGRHSGALGGDMEVVRMARDWVENINRAALSTGRQARKAMKEAGRLESELMRKYRVPVSAIDEMGGIPQELVEEAGVIAADATMHAFHPAQLPPAFQNPFWRTVLQFKSFIYKQTEFMNSEVLLPGMRWLVTDGAQGDIRPLLRASIAMPMGGMFVSHLRDYVKSAPTQAMAWVDEMRDEQKMIPPWEAKGKWKYKRSWLEDPHPVKRVWRDITYVGTLGLLGDAIDAAAAGRMWKYGVGPTFADIFEGVEAPFRGKKGEFFTRQLPGALGIPYSEDIFEELRRKLQ